jgi:hypothetical protein
MTNDEIAYFQEQRHMKKLTGSQLFGGANEGAQNQGDK